MSAPGGVWVGGGGICAEGGVETGLGRGISISWERVGVEGSPIIRVSNVELCSFVTEGASRPCIDGRRCVGRAQRRVERERERERDKCDNTHEMQRQFY